MLKLILLCSLILPLAVAQQIFTDIDGSSPYYAATRRLYFRGALSGAGSAFNTDTPADMNFLSDLAWRAMQSGSSGNPPASGSIANLQSLPGVFPILVGNQFQYSSMQAQDFENQVYFGQSLSRIQTASILILMWAYQWQRLNSFQLVQLPLLLPPVGGIVPLLKMYSTDDASGLSSIFRDVPDVYTSDDYNASPLVGFVFPTKLSHLLNNQGTTCDIYGDFCPANFISRGDLAVWVDGMFLGPGNLTGGLPPMVNPVTFTVHSLGTITDVSDYEDNGEYAPSVVAGSKTIRVPLRGGGYREVPRRDLVSVDPLAYSREPQGKLWKYTFRLHSQDAVLFRVGDEDEDLTETMDQTISEQPEGWRFNRAAWSRVKADSPDQEESFALTSAYKPGLIPVFFQSSYADFKPGEGFHGKVATGAEYLYSAHARIQDRLNESAALSWSNNSLKRFVIGPAFSPNYTQKEVELRIALWAGEYGFTFLDPLVAHSTRAVLEQLSPSTDLEKEIVECLREVL